MTKLYCNRCGKEILTSESCSSLEFYEHEYCGGNSFRSYSYHETHEVDLCSGCNELLRTFLGLQREEKFSWE